MNIVNIIKKQQVVYGIIIRNKPANPLSSNSQSFKCKTSITKHTYNIGDGEEKYDQNKVGKNETGVVIPLKHLSDFWRSLNIPLINCEVELILTSSISFALADPIFC